MMAKLTIKYEDSETSREFTAVHADLDSWTEALFVFVNAMKGVGFMLDEDSIIINADKHKINLYDNDWGFPNLSLKKLQDVQ
jgi:hypothetical protein